MRFVVSRVDSANTCWNVHYLIQISACKRGYWFSSILFHVLLSYQQLLVIANCCQTLQHPVPCVAELPAVACCSQSPTSPPMCYWLVSSCLLTMDNPLTVQAHLSKSRLTLMKQEKNRRRREFDRRQAIEHLMFVMLMSVESVKNDLDKTEVVTGGSTLWSLHSHPRIGWWISMSRSILVWWTTVLHQEEQYCDEKSNSCLYTCSPNTVVFSDRCRLS